MKRLKIVACTAVVAASLTLASAATPDEPADGLVFDAMTAPATISYSGTVEAIDIGNHSEASVYRIEHRAPDLTQRVYLSPPRLHGDSVVSRGDASYFVDPGRHRIVETENDSSNDQIARDDNYLLLRANYRAVRRSADTFDGRTVREVVLVNKYTNRTTMLVRIDQQTKLVLDKQQFAPDGSLASETRFQDVRYAPNPPAADFDVPKGLTVVRGPTFTTPSKDVPAVVRAAGFAAAAPKFLPHGFSPIEASVVPIKGVRTLHVLYSDGIRTVSLFENDGTSTADLTSMHPQTTQIAGRDAEYAERGPTTLLAWNYANLHCALVGELTIAEMQRIAASVSP
jgi:negative regulator of sigma E activity